MGSKPSAKCRKTKTCGYKTRRGNVYDLLSSAQKVTRGIIKETGVHTEAYKCDICGKYHVGKPNERYF